MDTTWMNDNQLDAWSRAAGLIARGWSIVPIKRGTKRPPYKDWAQFWTRKPTQDEIASWIRAGIVDWGVMCGPVSNLVVVDLDDADARAWAMEQGLGTGPSVATGKGWHHYFMGGNDANLTKVIGLAGRKFDVLTNGGMVLAAGSMHPSGEMYEWIDEHEDLQPLPVWIREAMLAQSNGAPTKGVEEAAERVAEPGGMNLVTHGAMGTVVEGSRNVLMHKVASSCRGKEGLGYTEILDRLRHENMRVCVPPLDESELKTIAQSAMQYEAGAKRYPLTDEGNLDRLVDKIDGSMRYVRNGGFWLTWNGKRWVEESDLMVEYLAKLSNKSIMQEVQNPALDNEERKELFKHYQRSMSYNRISSVAKLARSDKRMWIDANELDTDPGLFNTTNGTVNLRTGELRPHNRDDFITKIGGVTFNQELFNLITSPNQSGVSDILSTSWVRFCRGMFSKPGVKETQDLLPYFQRLLGYSLTGNTREQKWFLWRGTGANGKSTTTKILGRIMGDYAIYIDVKTFMKQNRNSEANMARARGARLVMTAEPGPGSRLDETLMKQATGGGSVEARYLYQKPFSYHPTWKIIMEANSRPAISGGDEGNYRRIEEISFKGNFMMWPEDTNDQYHYGYSRSIDKDLEAESEFILAWIVVGAVRWFRDGLKAPKQVAAATMQYRAEMDEVLAFIDDCCEVSENYSCSSREVHTAFLAWGKLNGFDDDRSIRWVGDRLGEKGFERVRISKAMRGFQGLRLRPRVLDELHKAILEA